MTVNGLLSMLAAFTERTDDPLDFEVVLDTPGDARYQGLLRAEVDHDQRKVFLRGG